MSTRPDHPATPAPAPPAPPGRWLTEQEQASWLALVGVIVRLPAALDRQLQRDAGITHFDYQVMACLSTAPDRTLRMSTLADLAQAQLPRLSQVVSRLETRGWVTRDADPRDGRCTLAQLTDAGWQKVVASAPGHVDAVRTLVFEQLTAPQVRQLGAIGRRILQAVDPG